MAVHRSRSSEKICSCGRDAHQRRGAGSRPRRFGERYVLPEL